MSKVLPCSFFERKTTVVAKDLVGKKLVRKIKNITRSFIITEVEAYIGPHDLASHASKGRTPRTEIMFGKPGTIYVYLIYGMYYMLNIVTKKKDYPAAILIRGVDIVSGPGRVARDLGITKVLNGLPLSKKTGLWIEDVPEKIHKKDIFLSPRIGVSYAGPIWAKKKLRYQFKNTI